MILKKAFNKLITNSEPYRIWEIPELIKELNARMQGHYRITNGRELSRSFNYTHTHYIFRRKTVHGNTQYIFIKKEKEIK